jgi:hypothetical protein
VKANEIIASMQLTAHNLTYYLLGCVGSSVTGGAMTISSGDLAMSASYTGTSALVQINVEVLGP